MLMKGAAILDCELGIFDLKLNLSGDFLVTPEPYAISVLASVGIREQANVRPATATYLNQALTLSGLCVTEFPLYRLHRVI